MLSPGRRGANGGAGPPETHGQGCGGAHVPRLPGVWLQKRAPAVNSLTVVAIVTQTVFVYLHENSRDSVCPIETSSLPVPDIARAGAAPPD